MAESDAIRERVARHVCAMVIGKERVDAVMDDVVTPLQAERDTARAALAAIRDRHQRHGDRCSSCERHRHREPRLADTCDDPECRADGEQHPCWHWTTATRALGQEET